MGAKGRSARDAGAWPPVAVLLVTYNRPDEIRRVITSLVEHLKYEGMFAWHIADDASPEGYIEGIRADFPDLQFTQSVTKRKGWGANVNAALKFLRPYPFVYLNEDDYLARRDIDLSRGVALLQALKDVCIVRYDGLNAHALNLQLREVDTRLGRMSYLRVSKRSPHLNVYSNRPHLRDVRRVTRSYRGYPEGKQLGDTERSFAHTVKNKKGPDVAALIDGIERAYDHIGKSWKGGKHDRPKG